MPPLAPPLQLLGLTILNQSVEWSDAVVIGLLILLEGLLSIDNALVLGMLARRLPKHMRARALTYGLVGAFVFRVVAIGMASFLLQWTIVKLIGGAYLIYIALRHLLFDSGGGEEQYTLDSEGTPHLVDSETGENLDLERENMELEQRLPIGASLVTESSDTAATPQTNAGSPKPAGQFSAAAFWRVVLIIELTDIAFAVDSILAAIALAGSRQEKLWVVVTGGLLGVILMRFAAAIFIRLLERFPRFEISAYLLVAIIGLKLVADWGLNSDWSLKDNPRIAAAVGERRQSFETLEAARRELAFDYQHWLEEKWPLGVASGHHGGEDAVPEILDFHQFRRPESIAMWSLMLLCFGIGFLPRRGHHPPQT